MIVFFSPGILLSLYSKVSINFQAPFNLRWSSTNSSTMDNDSRGNIKNPQSNFIGPESRPRRPSKTQNAPIAPTQEKSNWNNNQCPPLPRSYTQTAASAHSTSNSQRTRSASSPCPPAKQESSGQPTVDPRHSSAKQQQSDSSIEIISKAAPTYTSHPTGNPSR